MYKEVVAATLVDFVIGDPENYPHPVRLIGRLAIFLEKFLYKLWNKYIGGVLLTIILLLFVLLTLKILLTISYAIGKGMGKIVEILVIYTAIAARDLAKNGKIIYHYIEKQRLDDARQKLQYIVSRDTENLDKNGIIRATIETIAENSVDGVIAPLFYAYLGGPMLVYVYKVINTLDSMIGYKNEKYREFGYFAAKVDDLLNFIPGRLSVIFISIASYAIKLDGKTAFLTGFKDGHKNPSLNSGYPEATYAGALGIQLGGENMYGKRVVLKPRLGSGRDNYIAKDISEAVKLLYATTVFTILIFAGVEILFSLLITLFFR